MKFKVPKNTLDKAIKSVSKAVPNKGVQPILNNILLENKNGHLKLNATDLDFSIEAIIPSINEEEGSITISAKKLEEIVSKLDDDDIYFNIDLNTKKANLICKKSNFDLIGISSEDFPKIERPETNSFITVSKEKFSYMTNLVCFSSSKYDLNNILGGIYFGVKEIEGKKVLELASTDGNRLSNYIYDLNESNEIEEKEVVVPLKIILDVQRILETSIDENINICFLDKQIIFYTQDRFIVSRLLDGTYPRFKQLIPKDQDKVAQVDRKELMSCLERVAIMANEITNLVKLSFTEGSLKIESSNQDFGQAADNIFIEYMGDPFTIFFNVKYLIDPLKHLDCEKVQFSMLGPVNPVLLKPISQENYIHLIMPIKHEN
jgi:DNA polymerase-3 subunit beta